VPSGGNCTGTAYDTPSWSRDGNRIVLDTGERLAVMNADGSGLTLLPATTADDGNPAFAPRGERIVYAGTNERGTTDLYVRRLDGGEPELIVHDADEPAWSIGTVLAYARSATSTSHDRAGATVASSPQASRPTGRLAAAGLRSCVRCRALSLTRPPGASTPSPRAEAGCAESAAPAWRRTPSLVPGRPLDRVRRLRPRRYGEAARQPQPRARGGADADQRRERLSRLLGPRLASAALTSSLAGVIWGRFLRGLL
jgi:hypothetical protein